MALELVDALVRCGAFDLVALDSVPALSSPLRDDVGTEHRNESLDRARLLSEAMRRLAANIDRTRTVVLFANRLVLGTSQDDEVTAPGGPALRFYSSVRLALERGPLVPDHNTVAGAVVKVVSVKNKVAPPLRSAELNLTYGLDFGRTANPPPSRRRLPSRLNQ